MALWHHYCPPGNKADLINGVSGGAIFKTIDNGETWTKLVGNGLPDGELSRIGLATSMRGNRVYVVIAGGRGEGAAGFCRSDNADATWTKSTADTRVTGSGYFSRVFVDPKNPDTLYIAQTSLYRSMDGATPLSRSRELRAVTTTMVSGSIRWTLVA